jgi:hypothetical protein
MVELRITCDRCHDEIRADRLKLVVASGALRGTSADPATLMEQLDLCPSCRNALEQWITAGEAASVP